MLLLQPSLSMCVKREHPRRLQISSRFTVFRFAYLCMARHKDVNKRRKIQQNTGTNQPHLTATPALLPITQISLAITLLKQFLCSNDQIFYSKLLAVFLCNEDASFKKLRFNFNVRSVWDTIMNCY